MVECPWYRGLVAHASLKVPSVNCVSLAGQRERGGKRPSVAPSVSASEVFYKMFKFLPSSWDSWAASMAREWGPSWEGGCASSSPDAWLRCLLAIALLSPMSFPSAKGFWVSMTTLRLSFVGSNQALRNHGWCWNVSFASIRESTKKPLFFQTSEVVINIVNFSPPHPPFCPNKTKT